MGELELFLFYPFADFCQQAIKEKPYPMTAKFVAPVGDYLGFKIMEIAPISWAEGTSNGNAGTGLKDTFTTYEATVRLSAYGDSALTKIQSLVCGLRDRSLTKIFKDKDIAYFGHTAVRDTSFGYADKIEIRYEVAISFRFIQGGRDRGEDPSYIEGTGVEGTYN